MPSFFASGVPEYPAGRAPPESVTLRLRQDGVRLGPGASGRKLLGNGRTKTLLFAAFAYRSKRRELSHRAEAFGVTAIHCGIEPRKQRRALRALLSRGGE